MCNWSLVAQAHSCPYICSPISVDGKISGNESLASTSVPVPFYMEWYSTKNVEHLVLIVCFCQFVVPSTVRKMKFKRLKSCEQQHGWELLAIRHARNQKAGMLRIVCHILYMYMCRWWQSFFLHNSLPKVVETCFLNIHSCWWKSILIFVYCLQIWEIKQLPTTLTGFVSK